VISRFLDELQYSPVLKTYPLDKAARRGCPLPAKKQPFSRLFDQLIRTQSVHRTKKQGPDDAGPRSAPVRCDCLGTGVDRRSQPPEPKTLLKSVCLLPNSAQRGGRVILPADSITIQSHLGAIPFCSVLSLGIRKADLVA
jgi:hypothetical protein